MYKLIGGDGKEYGPVTAEQLRQWVAEGRANADTKVQAEGQTDWTPMNAVPEFAALFAGAGAPPAIAGTAVPAAAAGRLPTTEELEGRDYQVDLGTCLSNGWALFKENMGLLIGASLVYFGILFGIALIGVIPIVGILGSIAQIVITGPLLGGLYWIFIQLVRGEATQVGDVFAGFKRSFGNLILVQIISGILAFVAVIPGLIMTGIGVAMAIGGKQNGSEALFATGMVVGIIGGILLLVGFAIAIYLTICWVFAIPLVIDRQMGFWDAMGLSRNQVRKHWWGIFGALFVFGLIGSLGFLLCGIGALFTMPVAIGAIVYLYEGIFGGTTAQGA